MRGVGVVTLFAAVGLTGAAKACTFVWEYLSAAEMMGSSKPVSVDGQCRTINAGVFDSLSLGPATDLGNGRVQQVADERRQSQVLLADCNTREVTILQGAESVVEGEETSCGPVTTLAPIVGDEAPLSLASGANLHELVALAATYGATEIDPNEYFFRFRTGWDRTRALGHKDRFDLLCGCKLFYPDSPGARH